MLNVTQVNIDFFSEQYHVDKARFKTLSIFLLDESQCLRQPLAVASPESKACHRHNNLFDGTRFHIQDM